MRSLDEFSEVVTAIYEAGVHSERWGAALDSIARAIGARAGGLIMSGPSGALHIVAAVGADPAVADSYMNYYGKIDPVIPEAMARPAGSIVTQSMIIHRSQMLRTEFYNDWLRPQAIDDAIVHVVGGDMPSAFTFAAPATTLFKPEAVDRMRLLERHLQSAMDTQQWLGGISSQLNSALSALDQIARAVFFLDEYGSIVLANGVAERLLREADAFVSVSGKLEVAMRSQVVAFRGLVGRSIGVGGKPIAGGRMFLRRPTDNRPLVVKAVPLSRHTSFTEPLPAIRALVIAGVPEDPIPPQMELQNSFGLTPAEARVAQLICKGHGVKETARQLKIASSTARTHLLRVYAKTGVGRQAELAHLLANLV